MSSIANAAALLAAIALGLMAGALVAEGALLVPFWRSLQPADFLAWYRKYAALLQGFFGPLEVVATVLTIAAAMLEWFDQGDGRYWLASSAILGVAVLAVFPVYFQRANTSFRTEGIAIDRVQGELKRWSCWHWGRTTAGVRRLQQCRRRRSSLSDDDIGPHLRAQYRSLSAACREGRHFSGLPRLANRVHSEPA